MFSSFVKALPITFCLFGCLSLTKNPDRAKAIYSRIDRNALKSHVLDEYTRTLEKSTINQRQGSYSITASLLERSYDFFMQTCMVSEVADKYATLLVNSALNYHTLRAATSNEIRLQLEISLYDRTNIDAHTRVPRDISRFVLAYYGSDSLKIVSVEEKSDIDIISPLQPTYKLKVLLRLPPLRPAERKIRIDVGPLEQLPRISLYFDYPLPSTGEPESITRIFKKAEEEVGPRR